jgi:hypothetical protein
MYLKTQLNIQKIVLVVSSLDTNIATTLYGYQGK